MIRTVNKENKIIIGQSFNTAMNKKGTLSAEKFMSSEEFRKRGREKIDNICRRYGFL